MKKLIGITLLCLAVQMASSQKFYTREGQVSFKSDAPLEVIEAINYKSTAVLDTETGQFQMAVLVKAFQFEKALMQEHFNENYMETDKYPKSEFKGRVVNMEEVDFDENGTYDIALEGNLLIHGITQAISTPASLEINGDGMLGHAVFSILVEDYEIKIPNIVRDNVADKIDITVSLNLIPLNQ